MKFKLSSFEIIIHFFSIVIIFIAGYYYLERTLPFDGAFYSFRMSETGWFCIDNYRYGAEYTQVLPLLLLKAGCSLKTFLVSYSVSFALCNYIACLIILYVYKNPKIALGLLLATILAYNYKFFYPVSEIHSTTGPLFLLAAHIFNFENRKRNYTYFLVATLYITWALLIHVISIIPAFFILTYYAAYTKSLRKNAPILLFCGALFCGEFLLSKIFLSTGYIASKMIGIKEIMQFVSHPNAAAGYVYFKEEFLFNYLPLELLYIGCLVFLLIKKEYLQFLTVLVFTLGTWLIIMAYNLNKDAPIVYMNYYGLFGFYIAFPFCAYAVNYISTKKFSIVYAVLIVCSLAGVIRSGALISDQVNYYKRVTDQMKTSKGIVSSANIDWNSIWVSWDLSFQSLLFSTSKNPQQSKTFFVCDEDSTKKKFAVDPDCFYNTFFSPTWFKPPFANKQYYAFHSSGYTCLNSPQDSLFKDSLLTNKNIEILAEDKTFYLFKNSFRTIPVTVVNNSRALLPSTPKGEKQVNLSYQILNKNKEVLFDTGKSSAIEMDIATGDNLTTGLCLDCTQLHRGQVYYIDVDLVIEHKRRLGINKRIKIVLL